MEPQPTMELRLYWIEFKNGAFERLQQKFISQDGTAEWRDVPVVIKTFSDAGHSVEAPSADDDRPAPGV